MLLMADPLPRLDRWIEVGIGTYYTDKYGNVGRCIERRESDFGHRWARLDYGDGKPLWHRTSLLTEFRDAERQPEV